MINLVEMITNVFYILLLVLCIFVVVHASLQIKNSQYSFISHSKKQKTDKKKMVKIIVIGIAISLAIYFKIISGFSSYKANDSTIESYKNTVEELNFALSLEFSTYRNGTYTSAKKVARFIESQLPIKNSYYMSSEYEEAEQLSKYEILQYKLDDFVNKPTLVTYDGVLMSIIKFNEGCEYINKRNIAKSDCIIEVDTNHYEKPNQIGQDRVLMAIDGNTNEIVTDPSFFKN